MCSWVFKTLKKSYQRATIKLEDIEIMLLVSVSVTTHMFKDTVIMAEEDYSISSFFKVARILSGPYSKPEVLVSLFRIHDISVIQGIQKSSSEMSFCVDEDGHISCKTDDSFIRSSICQRVKANSFILKSFLRKGFEYRTIPSYVTRWCKKATIVVLKDVPLVPPVPPVPEPVTDPDEDFFSCGCRGFNCC